MHVDFLCQTSNKLEGLFKSLVLRKLTLQDPNLETVTVLILWFSSFRLSLNNC
jgi:hypothetical protein